MRQQLENFTVNDFVLNTSLIDDSTQVVANIASNAEPASAGFFSIGVMLVLYAVLTFYLYDQEGRFRLDFPKASLYASGFALGVGIIMFSLGWVGNFRYLLWIGLIYLFSFLVAWADKER